MEISILFFGPLSEAVGASEAVLTVAEGSCIRDALEQLTVAYPSLSLRLSTVAVAVNESYVGRERGLSAGDTLALIPPVSGG